MKGFHLKAIALATAVMATPLIGFSASTPGVTLLGMGGTYLSAWADGMMPVKFTADSLTYADLQLQGNTSDSGVVSLGSGYRKQSGDAIWGAYVFYDRERSSAGGYYNVASPGVEYLTNSWRYRLNYYAPFGTKTHLVDEGWADGLGNYSYIQFSGHEELDQWGYEYESLSYGGDIDVAYRFKADDRWEVSLSPYAFDRKDESTLVGSNFKLSYYQGDYATLFIGDGYDNASHNRVFVGASFNLSGRNNDNTMSNLMMSPVYRNLDVNTTSDGLSVGERTQYSGVEEVEENNIYFIDNNNANSNQRFDSYEDGTYEHPYTSMDSVNDSGNPSDANYWVAESSANYGSTEALTLVGTQTLEGRSANFKREASASNAPTIVSSATDGDGLILNGTNTVSDIALKGGNVLDGVGITVNGDATIDSVTVGISGPNRSFQTGVELADGATATISDSTISAYSNTFSDTDSDGRSDAHAIGVKEGSNAKLTISESTINSATGSDGGSSRAVHVVSGATAMISDSTLTVSGGSGSAVMGLFADGAGTIEILNSTITSSSSAGSAYGLYASGVEAIDVSGSTITSSSSASRAYGVYARNTSENISIDDNVINVTATANDASGSATGVYVINSVGSVLIADSTFNIGSSFSRATGVEARELDPAKAGVETVTVTGDTFNIAASTLANASDILDAFAIVSSSENTVNYIIG